MGAIIVTRAVRHWSIHQPLRTTSPNKGSSNSTWKRMVWCTAVSPHILWGTVGHRLHVVHMWPVWSTAVRTFLVRTGWQRILSSRGPHCSRRWSQCTRCLAEIRSCSGPRRPLWRRWLWRILSGRGPHSFPLGRQCTRCHAELLRVRFFTSRSFLWVRLTPSL